MTMAQVDCIEQVYFKAGDNRPAQARPVPGSWLSRQLRGLPRHPLRDIGAIDIRESGCACEPAASAFDLADRYR